MNHLKINECCILLEREEFPLIKRQRREEEEEWEGKKRKVQNLDQGTWESPSDPRVIKTHIHHNTLTFTMRPPSPCRQTSLFQLVRTSHFTVVNPIRLILSICAQEKGILVGGYVQQRPMVPFPNPVKGGFVKRSVFMDSTSPIGVGEWPTPY